MIQLRPLTLCVLMIVPACSLSAASATGVSWTYERKLERVQEERQTYTALANSAMGMSERAFSFAQKYQETLGICMAKLYGRDTLELMQAASYKKGGIGGPLDVRKQSRLP